MVNWENKIKALFHDPIVKAYDIKGHERIAKELLEILNLEYSRGDEDILSSSMDRMPLPFERSEKRLKLNLDDLSCVKHPMSASDLKIDFPESSTVFNELRKKISEIKNINNDKEKLFHALWWHLPDLAECSSFLPADTRFANHSIIDHLESTSALAGCVKKDSFDGSLISLSIGPVQTFISAARKTKDLWAGSYILSKLTYAAIEYIGKNYGFDSVIFPSVRNTAFVKDTLDKIGVSLIDIGKLPDPSKKVASLPNRLVAVVPSDEAKDILHEASENVRKTWHKMYDTNLKGKEAIDNTYLEKQLNTFPKIYTASQRILNPDKLVRVVKAFYKDSDIDKELENLIRLYKEFYAFEPNKGTFYKDVFRLLRSKTDATKSLRTFDYFEDSSSSNGKIVDGDDWSSDMKAIYEFTEVDNEGDEKTDRLNTVNAVKRSFAEKNSEYFPSVDDFAEKNKNSLEKIMNQFDKQIKKFNNSYYAILVMDGDKMGQWISGLKAPKIEDIIEDSGNNSIIKKLINKDESFPKELKEFLYNRSTIQPSYHRTVSRTLNIFSTLVENAIKEFGGELVYSGGDDVLAFLPATIVLQCANKIRKMYSGIGNVSIKNSGTEYKFNDEILYINGKPYATMMGKKATMSAGIAVINKKFPLRASLEIARNSEKRAKDDLERDSFVISLVRRSGQITSIGSKWNYENEFDVILELDKIMEFITNNDISSRMIRKLKTEVVNQEMPLLEKREYIERYIPYVVKKSINNKDLKKRTEEKFRDFYSVILNSKLYSKTKAKAGDLISDLPTDLILTQQFLWRGDEREA
jgi:CRISPR-associated protein Cmr2